MNPTLIKKEDPGAPKQHPQYSLLDVRKSKDPIWFIKIPDYLEDDLKNIKKPIQIGTIHIEHQPNGPPKATIFINNSVITSVPVEMLPSQYNISFDPSPNQSQYAFTHDRTTGTVRMMGHVNDNGIIKPPINETAKASKIRKYKEDLLKAKTHKTITPLLEVPKPTTTRPQDPLKTTFKKQVKDKRIRKSREVITRELIKAFKQNPEWKLRELADALDQGQDYVREVVENIAKYNPNTQMWVLRDELNLQ
ncbi:General transcription factor IIF subunit 2 [Histomonas meleagridis]|uniref:General transcription factor IIF subunit 2 n=1 Tax=Histomonas meleagridis TaxID=135588 RepID=UPI00355A0204|nr:General transcription factor IIF subunit 2 [Histomonas meleagridis]KAH0804837.1 General transcription factor IIF subunit 2 [Histomonas meleagridis]